MQVYSIGLNAVASVLNESITSWIFMVMYNKGMNTSQAVEFIEEEMLATDERDEIVTFIRESGRGIIKRYTKGSTDDDLPIRCRNGLTVIDFPSFKPPI